jgi:hypothetical protein
MVYNTQKLGDSVCYTLLSESQSHWVSLSIVRNSK